MWPFSCSLILLFIGRCVCLSGYRLTDDFSGNLFFSHFEAFTDSDPTQGFVAYHDYQSTLKTNLIGIVSNYNNASYMAVDSQNPSKIGRPSVRITSKKSFNHGLFIADIAHMPGGICGVWPAYWLVGPDWPRNGELDIFENVNDETANQMTLHTSPGCKVNRTGFSGTMQGSDCETDATGQLNAEGCGITSPSNSSYGVGFNKVGGGAYATEWNSTAIAIWFWPRQSIPEDVVGGDPKPETWGTPHARFAGECNIDEHFKDMKMVFDTTFCGTWAGRAWNQASCRSKAGSCEEYVGQNPTAFKEAYWLVNYVRVYSMDGN